jgi:hypothetical protein
MIRASKNSSRPLCRNDPPKIWQFSAAADLLLFELAHVLVRFNHVAGRIVNANHNIV